MNRSLPTFAEAEARNKLSHFTVQGFDLNGVLHAGTNDGEEIYNYMRFGIEHVLGFEPLRSAFQLCKTNVENWRRELSYIGQIELANYALSDWEGEDTLKVTAGDGKGSSLLYPKNENSEGVIVGSEACAVTTLPGWLRKHWGFDIAPFDTLVLDTQGNEFEILKGMGPLLEQFKYLCVELSIRPVYEGETRGRAIEDWLVRAGFTPDSPRLSHNDWFFVRKDIKPFSERIYKGKC